MSSKVTTNKKSINVKNLESDIEEYIKSNTKINMYNDDVKYIITRMSGKVSSPLIAKYLNNKFNTKFYKSSSIRDVITRLRDAGDC